MTDQLIVSIFQMNSGPDVAKNLNDVLQAIIVASKSHAAQLLVLPEVCLFRKQKQEDGFITFSLDQTEITQIQSEAKKQKIHVVLGSISKRSVGKSFSTQVVIDAEGKIMATYHKIHLFNAKIQNQKILESAFFKKGKEPCLINILGWKIGLSICYDLRFPELFRHYAKQGMDLILCPSSFMHETGQAHWEVLLRARAIENQCYVVAPNQVGFGAQNKPTYGHSLAIDPWGKIIHQASSDQVEQFAVTLNKRYLDHVRQTLPALTHRQLG